MQACLVLAIPSSFFLKKFIAVNFSLKKILPLSSALISNLESKQSSLITVVRVVDALGYEIRYEI